jgi:CBS domain-containing protein
MVAAYRDSIKEVGSSSSITVDPATDDGGLTYSAGDVLVLEVYGYTSIAAPSGSDLTWTEELSDSQVGPFSATDICKVFTAVADASITAFTLAMGVSDQWGYILTSYSGADTSGTRIDAKAISKNKFNVVADPTSPSISPATADAVLHCGAGVWLSSNKTSSMTPPSGMTEREDFGDWDHYANATLGLSASGATGTKAFAEAPPTSSSNEAWIAFSIAIKSASSGLSASVGTATETDAAQALGKAKTKAVGTVTETDAAQALSRRKAKAVTFPTETDAALPVGRAKTRSLGTVTETDAALPVGKTKVKSIGFPTETEVALPIVALKTRTLGVATETDAVFAVGKTKTKPIGIATETDTAFAFGQSGGIVVAIGTAVETDDALPAVSRKEKAVLTVVETDTALSVVRTKSKVLVAATETDAAFAMGKTKTKDVGTAQETDAAFGMTREGSGGGGGDTVRTIDPIALALHGLVISR